VVQLLAKDRKRGRKFHVGSVRAYPSLLTHCEPKKKRKIFEQH
jgi:hypothetical protein